MLKATVGWRKKQKLFQITLAFDYAITNDNVSMYIKFRIILMYIEGSSQVHTFTIGSEWGNLSEF